MRIGANLGVISDIHRVCTNPEVRIPVRGGDCHDPEGATNTRKLYILQNIYDLMQKITPFRGG